jgi:hypothetical protein
MASMTGSTDATGLIVTLTSGSLASWITAGSGTQVYLFSGTTLKLTAGTYMSVKTSSTVFTLSAAATANLTGLQVVISAKAPGYIYAWQQNCNPIPPTAAAVSLGAGYLGSDGGRSIDLAPAGLSGSVLWTNDDTYWATAASQNRTASAYTVHGCIAIQTGGNYTLNYNTSGSPAAGSDTLTFYAPTAASTTPAVILTAPGLGPGQYIYPYGGICINQYCTLILCAVFFPVTVAAPTGCIVWINNIKNGSSVQAPNAWNMQTLSPFGDGIPVPQNSMQWLTYTDSNSVEWVVGYGEALSSAANQDRNIYAFRWPYSDLNIGSSGTPYFGNVQYWCGPQGWVAADIMQSPQPTFPQLTPLFTPFAWPYAVLDNSGGVYERSDGSYVSVNQIYSTTVSGAMYFSNAPTITGAYGAWKQFYDDQTTYTSPTSSFVTYGLQTHVEQTWSGQATDDVLVSYATNTTNGLADARTVWPQFLMVSGM